VKEHIDSGICTHDDVRTVLEEAVKHEECAAQAGERFATTMRTLIVDEVFDANDLDIAVIELAIRAGVAVTMVGDPWQALYVFRGARPKTVIDLLRRNGVPALPLTHSFRWRSDAQRDLAKRLRAGEPVALPGQDSAPGTRDIDVALSREWKPLWNAGGHILPLAFGSFKGACEEAAATLLLNQLTKSILNEDATYLHDALTALAIEDPDAPRHLAPQLQEVLTLLKEPGKPALNAAYKQLDQVIRAASPRTLRRAHPAHTGRLAELAKRVLYQGQLVPGLTAHQAKGREWDTVGVYLSDRDRHALAAGLDVETDFHRQLYVACTRARVSTVAIGDLASA
jgi:DNA helicase-2/ATP-dependent DNA helicase PcrA